MDKNSKRLTRSARPIAPRSTRPRARARRYDVKTFSRAPPAPPTSILIVPFGPKLDFITSWSPFAALMFMNSAAALFMISAFGFTERRLEDAIAVEYRVRRFNPSSTLTPRANSTTEAKVYRRSRVNN